MLRRFKEDGGDIGHAEVRRRNTAVMLADAVAPDWHAVPAHVHIYVDNVD